MTKKKEDGFDMLARLIKEKGEDIRKELRADIDKSAEGLKKEFNGLKKDMFNEFAEVKKRLDITIQPQLDNHASRIKTLEYKTAKI